MATIKIGGKYVDEDKLIKYILKDLKVSTVKEGLKKLDKEHKELLSEYIKKTSMKKLMRWKQRLETDLHVINQLIKDKKKTK